jgi:hypothetical protein
MKILVLGKFRFTRNSAVAEKARFRSKTNAGVVTTSLQVLKMTIPKCYWHSYEKLVSTGKKERPEKTIFDVVSNTPSPGWQESDRRTVWARFNPHEQAFLRELNERFSTRFVSGKIMSRGDAWMREVEEDI